MLHNIQMKEKQKDLTTKKADGINDLLIFGLV